VTAFLSCPARLRSTSRVRDAWGSGHAIRHRTVPALTPADAAPRAEKRLLAIGLRLGAVSFLAIASAVLKLASEYGVNAAEMVFYRSAFGLPLVLLWVMLSPGLPALRTERPQAHLLRATLGVGSMLLSFQALVLLPLAEATTILFAAPVFATILSVLVLKEVVGRRRWSAVALGFAGVIVVMQPGSGTLPLLGVLVALAAAAGQAAVTITLRQISRSESTAAIVFWFTTLATLAGLVALPWIWAPHEPAAWGLLVLSGLAGASGQLMMTESLRHAPISVITPVDYVQILWAVAFGWLLFADPLAPTTLAGGALVASAAW
jgi:drug/metabolite transporter (DMT)-like permease